MKTVDVATIADRLLYGPNEFDGKGRHLERISHGKSIDSTATSPIAANYPPAGLHAKTNADQPPDETTINSAAMSPTLANDSPTELYAKKGFEPAESTVATTVVPDASPASSPTEQSCGAESSVASSPTVANSSPVELLAKHQYSVQEVEAPSPTSTNGTEFASPVKATDKAGSELPTDRRQRPLHPAVSAWKSLWSRPQATWHPTWLQIRPVVGIMALYVAIACVFASLAVLIVSNGQATDDWYVAPSVYLAIITAAANSAIALAYMEAVPIAFWCSMTRGRTVRSLERQWQVSRSMLYAIAKLRHLSVLNLACIAVAIVVIDGPLLQRASTVVRATQTRDVMLDLRMAPEIPSDFTGVVQNHLLQADSKILRLFPQYTTDEPMFLDIKGCKGTCTATIQAPGVLKSDCSQQVWQLTPEMLHSTNTSWGDWKTHDPIFATPSTQLPGFEVSVTPLYTLASSAALMRVGIATWVEAVGNYTMTTCTLLPAISEYDVEIEAGAVKILKTPNQGRVRQLANNTRSVDQSPSAMPLIQDNAMDAITVDVGLVTNSNASVILAESPTREAIFAPYPLTYNLFAAQHDGFSNTFNTLRWKDPTDDTVFVFNELMFRAGVMATHERTPENLAAHIDSGVEVDQTVSAKQKITQNVYKSDLRWYAGAAVVQVVTALITLPMFWGWWRLGCNLTLSPFSIALAFDAPVLSDINSAAGSAGVVDRLGGMKLKYGAVELFEEKTSETGFVGRLGVAESQVVFRPNAGMTFSR